MSDRCAEILVETGLIDKANAPAGSAQRCSAQAAGARPRAGDRAEAAAARRDRRRADRRRMPGAGRDDPRPSMQAASPIIWIEHVLHALNSVVERLLVLDFGRVIGIGKPDEIMASKRGPRNLSGDRGLMALLETRALTASYGDFQALFGVDISRRGRRDRRHHRRQRRRQDDADALDLGRARQRAGIGPAIGTSRSARCPRRIFWRAASPWCRKGGGCFRR